MSPKDLLNLLFIGEEQHSKESLFLFMSGLSSSTLFDERIGNLLVLFMDNSAVLTVDSDIIHHNNIVWSWILHDELHVAFIIKLDDIVSGLCLKFLHLLKFELTKFLELLRILLYVLVHLFGVLFGIDRQNHDDGP